MPELACPSPTAWLEAVLDDFDTFLLDHAAAEKKAAGMAISMLSHYPDKVELVNAMSELAVEEMSHFREVVKIIHSRGLTTGPDEKDPYVIRFRQQLRRGSDNYFLDRLLVGGVIEARGAERFGLIGQTLPAGTSSEVQLKRFYQSIARSEERHLELFVELAYRYFARETVDARLTELIAVEAEIMRELPIRAALH